MGIELSSLGAECLSKGPGPGRAQGLYDECLPLPAFSSSSERTLTKKPPGPPRSSLRFYRRIDVDSPWIGSRASLRPRDAALFEGDSLPAALARALCERRALPAKELFEATETFELVRKRVRGPVVADLCCGHGLAGILFAIFEREVDRVLLIDRERPASAEVLLEVAAEVAPWAPAKIEWRVEQLKRTELPPGTGVIAIHACGLRTDAAMDLAIKARGPFAALPCCRPHRLHPAPESLKNALGADVAIDVHRTYALEAAGYRVRWQDIAQRITPMHRVISAALPFCLPNSRAIGRFD